MNENKSFFSPSWDFFSWQGLKSLISTTITLAYKTTITYLNSPLRLFLVATVLATAIGIKFYNPTISIEDFFYYIFSSKYSIAFPWHIFIPVAIVFIALLAEAIPAILNFTEIMHTLTFKTTPQIKHRKTAILISLLSTIHTVGFSYATSAIVSFIAKPLFLFTLFFYMNQYSEESSFKEALKKGFLLLLKLLPVIALLSAISIRLFNSLELAGSNILAIAHESIPTLFHSIATITVPIQITWNIATFSLGLALFHTLYTKTLEHSMGINPQDEE